MDESYRFTARSSHKYNIDLSFSRQGVGGFIFCHATEMSSGLRRLPAKPMARVESKDSRGKLNSGILFYLIFIQLLPRPISLLPLSLGWWHKVSSYNNINQKFVVHKKKLKLVGQNERQKIFEMDYIPKVKCDLVRVK